METKGSNRRLIVGLATDGAPVMTGRKSGVDVQLRQKCSPYLVQVHSVAHHLALASGQATDAVGLFKTYQETVNSVYNHFAHSATHTSELWLIQAILDQYQVSLHTAGGCHSVVLLMPSGSHSVPWSCAWNMKHKMDVSQPEAFSKL